MSRGRPKPSLPASRGSSPSRKRLVGLVVTGAVLVGLTVWVRNDRPTTARPSVAGDERRDETTPRPRAGERTRPGERSRIDERSRTGGAKVAESADEAWPLPPRPTFELPEDPSEIQQLAADVMRESLDVGERLVRAYRDDPAAIHVLANVHQRHRSEAAAVQLWNRCLGLDPEFPDALMALGRLAVEKGEFVEAESFLRRLHGRDPHHPGLAESLGQALTSQGKFGEAIEILEVAAAGRPDDANVWSRLGQAYDQIDDAENAERCHAKALAIEPELSQSVHGLAMALQKLGRTDEAEEYFGQVSQLQQRRSIAVRGIGADQGDRDRLKATQTNTYTSAGLVYAQRGRTDLAEKHWRKAAEVDDTHVESRDLLISLYARGNRLAEALRICRELTETDSENADVWGMMGLLAVRGRDLGTAEKSLRRAIELEPDNADHYALLAQVQMSPDRDPAEAVRFARRAVELNPTGGHLYILATARWHAGDVEAAREALRQAIRLEPANLEYRQAYAQLAEGP